MDITVKLRKFVSKNIKGITVKLRKFVSINIKDIKVYYGNSFQ